jgi:hypothetical protein
MPGVRMSEIMTAVAGEARNIPSAAAPVGAFETFYSCPSPRASPSSTSDSSSTQRTECGLGSDLSFSEKTFDVHIGRGRHEFRIASTKDYSVPSTRAPYVRFAPM